MNGMHAPLKRTSSLCRAKKVAGGERGKFWKSLEVSMNNLVQLAELIKEKNVVDGKIASILWRPAQVGHAGEYIAAALLGIQLHQSASHASSDGRFLQGPLTGRSVDIKWYL